MKLKSPENTQILGRYSGSGDIAASLTPFGKGWVGAVGPHPEADRTWCRSTSTAASEGDADVVGRYALQTQEPRRHKLRYWLRFRPSNYGKAVMQVLRLAVRRFKKFRKG